MKPILLAMVFATTLFSLPAGPVWAQQPGSSTCATPGAVVLANIPANKDDLIPSVSSQIAGYGRQAKVSNCTISLVCVAIDGSDAARDVATKQCVVVRDRLVKAGFAKDLIETARKSPGGGMAPGMVYFTVQ